MAGNVRFDDKHWKGFIRTLDKNVKNPFPILKAAFATRGFRDVISHFNAEKGEKGKWKKSQRAKREGGKTLQDTGNLRGGFLPRNIAKHGKNSIVFFNPVPYARKHDEGLDGLPQRDFMYLTDRAQEDMTKIILDLVIK